MLSNGEMFSAQPRTAVWELLGGGGGISTGPVSERPLIVSQYGVGYRVDRVLGIL